jgi:hypothetical protein
VGFSVSSFVETSLRAIVGDTFITSVEKDVEGGAGVSGCDVEGDVGIAFSVNSSGESLHISAQICMTIGHRLCSYLCSTKRGENALPQGLAAG